MQRAAGFSFLNRGFSLFLPVFSQTSQPPPVVLRLLEMKGGDVSNNSIRLLLDLYEQWLADGKPERGKVDAKK